MEVDLQDYEKRCFSQNGEDGILEKIFEIIGTTNKYYVEFGASNGSENNTRNLSENFGWTGLLMDGFFCNPGINLQREFVTAGNINRLLQKYKVPTEFDLLSIDIDYNDFYVWRSLSARYSPRIIVIEYNSLHKPPEDKIVEYNPFQLWDGTNYFGASLTALCELGKRHYYSLVYVESTGTNAFFMRNDCLPREHTFPNINNIEALYKPPGYKTGPHPPDLKNRKYVSSAMMLKQPIYRVRVWEAVCVMKKFKTKIISCLKRVLNL